MNVSDRVECEKCGGMGYDCARCGGTGKITPANQIHAIWREHVYHWPKYATAMHVAKAPGRIKLEPYSPSNLIAPARFENYTFTLQYNHEHPWGIRLWRVVCEGVMVAHGINEPGWLPK